MTISKDSPRKRKQTQLHLAKQLPVSGKGRDERAFAAFNWREGRKGESTWPAHFSIVFLPPEFKGVLTFYGGLGAGSLPDGGESCDVKHRSSQGQRPKNEHAKRGNDAAGNSSNNAAAALRASYVTRSGAITPRARVLVYIRLAYPKSAAMKQAIPSLRSHFFCSTFSRSFRRVR